MPAAYLRLKALLHRDEAQAMVEYALILGFLAIGLVTLLQNLNGHILGIFDTIINKGFARVPGMK